MNKDKITATLKSKVGFYIGDACYPLDDETYSYWEKIGFKDGMVKVEKDAFAVGSTYYGDGEYVDNEMTVYPVDAGNIAAIPYELLEKQETWQEAFIKSNKDLEATAKALGGRFIVGKSLNFEASTGVFNMEIKEPTTHVYIDTLGEYEDNWEYPDSDFEDYDEEALDDYYAGGIDPDYDDDYREWFDDDEPDYDDRYDEDDYEFDDIDEE